MRIRPTCRNIVRALVFIAPPHLRGVESRGPGGDIGLQPDDWLYTSLGSFRIELVSPKQIAVIRNRHRGLLVLYSLRHQLLDFRRPIQNRIVCVDMEVDEIRGSHGSILPRRAPDLEPRPPGAKVAYKPQSCTDHNCSTRLKSSGNPAWTRTGLPSRGCLNCSISACRN